MANVQNNLGKSVPECKTIQDFAAAGDNGGGDDDSENSEIAPVRSLPPVYLPTLLLTGQILFSPPNQQFQSSESTVFSEVHYKWFLLQQCG